MTQQEANNIGVKFAAKAKSVHVGADGSIFINSSVEALQKHVKETGIKVFAVKGDEIQVTKQKKSK